MGGGGVVDKVGGGVAGWALVVAQLACGQLGRSPGGFFSLFFVLFFCFPFIYFLLCFLFIYKHLGI